MTASPRRHGQAGSRAAASAGWWLALGLGACSAQTLPPSRLCFEHVGPQDKPMPEFCLAQVKAAPADLPVTDPATWQAVLDRCREAVPESSAPQSGSYRVSADRGWPAHRVSPQAMRGLAAVLVEAARRQGVAPPAPIEQLLLRLGPN